MSQELLAVPDALRNILDAAQPIADIETVPLEHALGRTLGADLVARLTQPPLDVSAMDGYAGRAADFNRPDGAARMGESAAGAGYAGSLAAGECVRIYTGAPIPHGADTILLQEDARVQGDRIFAATPVSHGRHMRAAGLDFRSGDIGLAAGTRLGPAQLALAAAMNYAALPLYRKPRIAILAAGDELIAPGGSPKPEQIISSNSISIRALIECSGGEALDLGVVKDQLDDLIAAISRAETGQADALVTLGGASVGDRDLIKPALAQKGMSLAFWRIAMRPGKPLLHGALGRMRVIGLPGNPVSAFVGATIFVQPLVRKLAGDPQADKDRTETARLGADLPLNPARCDYIRARLSIATDGALVATPHPQQDSSLLSVLSQSEALIVRLPHAAAAKSGDCCRILRL